MHVKTKKIALAGMLGAFVIVLLVLSTIIESNTLFLMAAASFCVGIVIREWGLLSGAIFFASCTLLSFLLVPNKFYCITFSAMGLYLLFAEGLWEYLAGRKQLKRRNLVLWIGKYVFFNCIYLPTILVFPTLIVAQRMTGILFVFVLLAGQGALFIYDSAYRYFQGYIWEKFRKKLQMRRNL